MEWSWNGQTVEFLSQCFLDMLSPAPEPRRRAQTSLARAANCSNYGLMLLRLAAEPLEDYIRQAAAMYLENHLSNQWSSLLPWEKERIKSLIVPLMFSAPVKIQIQLGRAGAVIGYQDFVRTWPGLLQNLIQKLENASQASDYASVYDSLSIADSICKKFYRRPITTELILELRYFLDTFAAPLLEVFLKTASLIDASVNSSPNVLCPLFESQTLCCSIFHSLYNMERSEFFPVRMKEWETEFEKYLNTTYPSLEEDRDEVGEDYLLSELRCSARYNLELCFLYADETRTRKEFWMLQSQKALLRMRR